MKLDTNVQNSARSINLTSPSELSTLCADLYQDQSGLAFQKQKLRPFICPFHHLLPLVPEKSSLLDIGCGSGIFLGLLAHANHISHGYGFDANASAISQAQDMSERLLYKNILTFEHRDARDPWPEGQFDVVSILDVMHHVPPSAHQSVIRQAAERVKPGGRLIYKDMVKKPLWRATANSLHDLVLAREWIHYVAIGKVIDWAKETGLTVLHQGATNMLWYGHEWVVLEKTQTVKK